MSTITDDSYSVQPLPAVRLAQLTARVSGQHEISAAVSPLFGRAHAAIGSAAASRPGPAIAYFASDDDEVTIGVGEQVDTGAVPDGLEAFVLPAVARALVTTWAGDAFEGLGEAWQSLMGEADSRGLTLGAAPCRETYLATPMDEGGTGWVIEIQQPVV